MLRVHYILVLLSPRRNITEDKEKLEKKKNSHRIQTYYMYTLGQLDIFLVKTGSRFSHSRPLLRIYIIYEYDIH